MRERRILWQVVPDHVHRSMRAHRFGKAIDDVEPHGGGAIAPATLPLYV
jgi:hypothetical protein